MTPFSLLVKPAGADCNLACAYCFYKGKSALYPHEPHPRMTDETLRTLLRNYRGSAIAFQGGEPTLMGEAFFRKAQTWGKGISFSLQTNGTMITESFACFLADNGWLVGLSLDGPEAMHNRYRVTGGPEGTAPSGNKGGGGFSPARSPGTYRLARRGYDRLVAAGAAVNTLTLVTAANIHHAREVYRWLRDDCGSLHQQYIECTTPAAFAISAKDWGDFLIELFDTWYTDGDARRVSIRLFDALVGRMAYGTPQMCTFAADCRNYLVVEWNGDVYPCDFHVTKDLKLGNIHTDDLETLFNSKAMRDFGVRKRLWSKECDKCEFLPFCCGDCPKNRDPNTDRSRLCEGYRRFFAHALPILADLLRNTPH